MGFVRKLCLKFLRFSGLYALFLYWMNAVYLLNVLSVKETFEKIRQGKTIIRFGDGELRLLMGVGEAGFQKRNPEGGSRLSLNTSKI